MLKKITNKTRRLLAGNHRVWKAQPDDVFIVSYPRSGNTWLRYLLANLFEPEEEWNIDNINRVVPDLHQPWPTNWIKRHPRLLKSHESYNPEYQNVIYIYRDGRDVAISYHHSLDKVKGYHYSFNKFFEDYLIGHVPFGGWGNHITHWMFAQHPVNILTVQYENLVCNVSHEVARIGQFLQQPWTEEEITIAIEKSSYEKIQENYASFKRETHWNKGFQAGVKGGPGKWKEILTPEQNEQFWKAAGEVADRLGYRKEDAQAKA